MDSNLFISELLFTIIVGVAILVFWQLLISKNGMLRKIMLAYFLVEIYMFTFSAIWWYWEDKGVHILPLGTFRMLVLIPKVIVKIWLLWWLVKQNRKPKS
jgi:hypothetical protein